MSWSLAPQPSVLLPFTLVWLSGVELQNILNTFLVKQCETVKEGKYRILMGGASWSCARH